MYEKKKKKNYANMNFNVEFSKFIKKFVQIVNEILYVSLYFIIILSHDKLRLKL